MAISQGVRLGPYEILDRLGAGGMGEVYRARDTRLDRTVAIKVLAHRLTEDADMQRRFEREARAVAALSHPHICHLNDIGHQDGTDFLVMEYLEGETLAARLARASRSKDGAPGIDESLQYAIEMAEALNEAHRQGIVHRDLKPSNVMITRSGVKLLDFGLAKLQPSGVGSGAAVSTLANRHDPLTGEGAIVGTWPYMAPEQLEGRDADARTDIFAFGAVVYEMLTGKRAFEGESHASLIAAILDQQPRPISELQPLAPAALERVVGKCLAKKADARWQTARDLADELRWISDQRSSASRRSSEPATATPMPVRSLPWRSIAAVLGASLVTAAIVWNLPRGNDVVPGPVRRFTINPPLSAPLQDRGLAISPDGRQIVYVARTPKGPQLHVRALDQLEARALAGTEGGSAPMFSPDGAWVAFEADGKLKKVSLLSGEAPITLCDLPVGTIDQLGAWLANDTIIFGRVALGLFRVSGHGGTPVQLTKPDPQRGEIDHHDPSWLPHEQAVLVTIHRGEDAYDVAVLRLDTGERRVIVENAFDAKYVPTGHLVFARANTLFAAPFDAKQLQVSGPAVAVLENVGTVIENGAARYKFSEDGSLAYVPAIPIHGRRLVWVDRSGATEPLPLAPRGFVSPSLSPDGRRLAIEIDEAARRDIWIYEFAADTLTRLTLDGASHSPVWTPDGRRLTFTSTRDGRRQIYWQAMDGTGQPELLVAGQDSLWPGSWSPDLQVLAYTRLPPTNLSEIGLFRRADSAATPLSVPEGHGYPRLARISPDGRWLAYQAITAMAEIFVVGLSGATGRRQVSTDGGHRPVWSRDGREIFYRYRGGAFAVVSVDGLPATSGKPIVLPVRVRLTPPELGHPGFDVSPDGRRLLVVEAAEEESAPRPIHVVLNWFDELRRRVPIR